MTTVHEWIDADARRRAPEYDFGTDWTREHEPTTQWAVTYNTGTGELYARTRNGDDVEVLGRFADSHQVAAAIPDWGRRSAQPGSLDRVRRELPTPPTPDPAAGTGRTDPVYAVALSPDGTTHLLREPTSIADIATRLDTLELDAAPVDTGNSHERVRIWVDHHAGRDHPPVNVAATRLRNSGWPIVGNAIVVADDRSPLPAHILDRVDMGPDDPQVERPAVLALEWEDRLRDLERPDRDLGIDLDTDSDFHPHHADRDPDVDHGPTEPDIEL